MACAELNVPLDDLASLEAYKTAMTNLATHACDANKRATALDAKVKKWQDVPDEVLALNIAYKDKAASLALAAGAYQISKKSFVVDKMHQAMSAFIQQRLEAGLQHLMM